MKIIIRTTESVPVKLVAKFKAPNALEWADCSFCSFILELLVNIMRLIS